MGETQNVDTSDPVLPVDLDLDDYIALGDRRPAFDEWLEVEGLFDQRIFYVRFGEGYVDAKCLLYPYHRRHGEVAWEWRRYSVTTIPPFESLRR